MFKKLLNKRVWYIIVCVLMGARVSATGAPSVKLGELKNISEVVPVRGASNVTQKLRKIRNPSKYQKVLPIRIREKNSSEGFLEEYANSVRTLVKQGEISPTTTRGLSLVLFSWRRKDPLYGYFPSDLQSLIFNYIRGSKESVILLFSGKSFKQTRSPLNILLEDINKSIQGRRISFSREMFNGQQRQEVSDLERTRSDVVPNLSGDEKKNNHL